MKKSVILFLFITSCMMLSGRAHSAELLARTMKFELIDNRIFVDVFINKQGPFKFIFDTGGNNSMTFDLAHRLNLPVKDIGDGTGAGEASQKLGETHVREMQFGEIHQSDLDFLVMDYSKIQKAFALKALDGVFGFETLQRFLVLIDYENSVLSFYENSVLSFYENASDVNWSEFESLKFDLVYDKPFIKTSIMGKSANTLIDTGDRSALTVAKRFRKHGVIDKAFRGKPTVVSGYGIGGPIPAQISSLKAAKVGRAFAFSNVAARAPTGNGGFNSIEGLDASIGNEILKQWTVGLDYRNKRIFFKKNKRFGAATKFTPVPNPSPEADFRN